MEYYTKGGSIMNKLDWLRIGSIALAAASAFASAFIGNKKNELELSTAAENAVDKRLAEVGLREMMNDQKAE